MQGYSYNGASRQALVRKRGTVALRMRSTVRTRSVIEAVPPDVRGEALCASSESLQPLKAEASDPRVEVHERRTVHVHTTSRSQLQKGHRPM